MMYTKMKSHIISFNLVQNTVQYSSPKKYQVLYNAKMGKYITKQMMQFHFIIYIYSNKQCIL